MTHTPKVSVIIPTHNRAALLRETVASVQAQTITDWELLIVNDGSTDETEAVGESLAQGDARIRYIGQANQGLSATRNRAIRMARGAFVAFLDDDDRWEPHKLERQLAVLEHDPGVGLVTCRAWIINETGKVVGQGEDYEGEPTFQRLVDTGCVANSPSSVLMRRACFDRVGVFDTRYLAGDYELYLRLALAYRLVFIREPLYFYRVHQANMSGRIDFLWHEHIRILQELRPSPSHGVTKADIRAGCLKVQRFHYALAMKAMEESRYRDAARIFLDAICLDPLIGLKLPWSRYRNPIYRTLRPYVSGVRCGVAALCGRPARSGATA